MEQEIWKDIPRHQGYQCSNLGRIRSTGRRVRFVTKTGGEASRMTRGRILKTHLNKGRGYVYVHLGRDFKTTVHRIMAMTYLDEFSDSLDVDHRNGDRRDNRLSNIRMVTRKENINNPVTKVFCLTRARDSSGRFLKMGS